MAVFILRTRRLPSTAKRRNPLHGTMQCRRTLGATYAFRSISTAYLLWTMAKRKAGIVFRVHVFPQPIPFAVLGQEHCQWNNNEQWAARGSPAQAAWRSSVVSSSRLWQHLPLAVAYGPSLPRSTTNYRGRKWICSSMFPSRHGGCHPCACACVTGLCFAAKTV